MAKAKQTVKLLASKDKGKLYSHGDFNIKFPVILKPHVTIGDEEFLFVTIKNKGKFRNELHQDGVVHEPEEGKDLLKGSEKDEKHKDRHILVRFHSKGDLKYEYIGDELSMVRYDQTRNKIFVG
jgi:hypothetical protein